MTLPFWRALAPVLLAAWLAGCGTSSTYRTYVLGTPTSPTVGVWPETELPVIALKTVMVPDYLDSSDILRRTGPNELGASPTGRWGERLSLGLTHALAAALTRQLPRAVVSTTFDHNPAKRIIVDVDKFEIETDGHCLIAAQWRITMGDAQNVSQSGRGTFTQMATSIDDPAVAAAMSRAIDQLAQEIVKAMGLE